MDHFVQQITDFQTRINRMQELETYLPQLQSQLDQKKESLSDLQLQVAVAKYELEKLENPGFFRRILGISHESIVMARQKVYTTTSARDQAQFEKNRLQEQIEAAKGEFESLSGIQEEYLTFLEAHTDKDFLWPVQQLNCQLALEEAWSILEALEAARGGARRDALTDRVPPGRKKLDYFNFAQERLQYLLRLLGQIREHNITLDRYLRSGTAYITGVTSEFKQLDRLNTAIDQIREVRTQLKYILKEVEQ